MAAIINSGVAFDNTNTDHLRNMQTLATDLKGLVSTGDTAGAQTLYNTNKAQNNFTDADFSSYYDPKFNNGQYGFANNTGAEQTVAPAKGIVNTYKAAGTPSAAPAPAPEIPTGATVVGQSAYTPAAGAGAGAYTPATAAVSNYTAQGVATTPGMSAQYRMRTMLDPNDPFNQAATTQAKQTFNERGLLNSSMAATGTTDSIIRNALSIAQPDAAMEVNNAQFSANAQNQAAQFGAAAANTASLQSNTQAYDAYKINMLQAFNLQNMSVQQTNELQKMATANGYELNKMSITQVNDMVKLSVTTGSSERIAAANNATSTANNAANNATSIANQNSGNATSVANTTANNATSTTNTNSNNATNLATNAANNATSAANTAANNATTIANTKLNGDNQIIVNAAQNKHAVLLQNNSTAGTLLRDYTNAVANIQNNSNMDGPAKQTAIENLGQTFDANMSALKGTVGGAVPDYGSYLDFGDITDEVKKTFDKSVPPPPQAIINNPGTTDGGL